MLSGVAQRPVRQEVFEVRVETFVQHEHVQHPAVSLDARAAAARPGVEADPGVDERLEVQPGAVRPTRFFDPPPDQFLGAGSRVGVQALSVRREGPKLRPYPRKVLQWSLPAGWRI